MKASSWNWVTPRPAGLSKYGPRWLKPIAVAIPWITVLILLQMLYIISNTLTVAKGVAFDLPEGDQIDGTASPLVALVVPSSRDTLVFFDDARYSLDDRESLASFGEHLATRAAKVEDRTLVVMADSRVTCEDVSRLATVARTGGIRRMLFANKAAKESSEE